MPKIFIESPCHIEIAAEIIIEARAQNIDEFKEVEHYSNEIKHYSTEYLYETAKYYADL